MIPVTVFLVTLLLVVRSEWVEITQQSYRKSHRPSSVSSESNEATIDTKVSPYHKIPASSSRHPNVQSVKLRSSDYANVTLKHNWIKDSALNVPGNIARIEYMEKPANRYEEIDINSEELSYNNEHVTMIPNIKRLAAVPTPNTDKNMSKNTKNESNNKNGNLFTVRRKDPDQNDNAKVKQNKHTIDGITMPHNLAEKSLEIYEISIPHNDRPSATPIKISQFRNKGTINRINMYSTNDPNANISFVTEKPHQQEVQYKYSSDKSKPPSHGNHHGITKAPVSVSKGNIKRIYIHDIKKSDEAFIDDDILVHKKSTNINAEDYAVSKNNESKSNDISNKQSNKHFQRVPVVKTKPIVRIYINSLKTPKEPLESSTRKQPTIVVAQDRLDTNKYVDHSLENDGVGDKAISENTVKRNELLIKNIEENNAKSTEIPINYYGKGGHITKINKAISYIQQKSKEVLDELPNSEEFKTKSDDGQTTITKIDTFSIKKQHDPEFVTKQEFTDDYDAKYIYKDYEEIVNVPNATSLTLKDVEKSHENITQEIINVNLRDKKPNMSEINLSEQINVEISAKPNIHKDTNYDSLKSSNGSNGNEATEKTKNPLENIIKFMKIVSDTISKNTQRGVKSKMRYLEDLRDTLLMNIQNRVDEAWPDDDSPQHKARDRQRRDARGHVEFPSSEGALMSISFLTFAVFLIKLVLQVINTYKNKTMMMTPTVFAVSRAAAALRSPGQD